MQNASLDTSSSSEPSCYLLDPNPSLIDKDGKLINNINLAASLTSYRNGTIADGVSKLILIVHSKISLQFSINDTKPDRKRKRKNKGLGMRTHIIQAEAERQIVSIYFKKKQKQD